MLAEAPASGRAQGALALAKDTSHRSRRRFRLPGPTGRAALGLAVGELQHRGKANPRMTGWSPG